MSLCVDLCLDATTRGGGSLSDNISFSSPLSDMTPKEYVKILVCSNIKVFLRYYEHAIIFQSELLVETSAAFYPLSPFLRICSLPNVKPVTP